MLISSSTKKVAQVFPDGKPMLIVRKPPHRVYSSDEVFRNAKVRLLPDGMCKVTCFQKPRYKLDGFEVCDSRVRADVLQGADKPKKEPCGKSEPKVSHSSWKRAKDKIFEIAAANKWDYMVTFTLDSQKVDRYSVDEVRSRFGKWLDNQVQRKGLKALIVPELHKDGAIHFHGLINDSLSFVHSGTYKVRGCKSPVSEKTLKRKYKLKPGDEAVQDVYNIKEYKLGFSTAIPIDFKGGGSVSAISFYMTKYCTKELDKIFGGFYMAVGKINRELPYVLCNLDFERVALSGKVCSLPEGLGSVCYAMLTKDDFEGVI